MTKNVLVLGSTGSIGENALDVLRELGDPYRIVGLSGGANAGRLAEQARDFRCPRVALADASGADDLCAGLPDAEVFVGSDGIVELVRASGADIVIAAISGAAGLEPVLAAAATGARIALANKEACVVAGHLLLVAAEASGSEIIPVDSEHSAVFQSLAAGRREDVRRIVLTASGGPFRTRDAASLRDVTIEEALNHPTWNMGRKITIDSSTLMNKALEVIEARWLFDVTAEQIAVTIHPQSIVHSLVEWADGSVIAQLGRPDMRLPIRYALTHPERPPGPHPGFDVRDFANLTFEAPDTERFPALELGFRVAREGGTSGAVFNAANEAAVEAFLAGRLAYVEIAERVRDVLDRHEVISDPTLETIQRADAWAREEIAACLTS